MIKINTVGKDNDLKQIAVNYSIIIWASSQENLFSGFATRVDSNCLRSHRN